MKTTVYNKDVVRSNEIVYLAVKPYIVPEVLGEIAEEVTSNNLIVSIAAGITLDTIEKVGFEMAIVWDPWQFGV